MRVFALGYCGTGSSAITHLIKEYANCQNGFDYEYEHILFYVPHGLFDLEDILLNNNAIFRSDAAINDFYNAMKRLNDNDFGWFGGYGKKYGNRFMNIVDTFVKSLIEYTTKGGWSNDFKYSQQKVRFRTKVKHFLKRCLFFTKDNLHNNLKLNTFGDDGVINYCYPTPDEFYKKAKIFVDSYFDLVGYDSNKVIVVDQIIQPHQLWRFMNYANDDDRFIVVKRDVRDIFLYSKYVWAKNVDSSFFPTDPMKFSSFYSRFLSTEKIINDPRIMRINFEELVYEYNDVLRKIENFIGDSVLGEHSYAKRFFNPEQSIKNTQLFNIKKEWRDEVRPIEENMKEYLYPFPVTHYFSKQDISDPNPNTYKKH